MRLAPSAFFAILVTGAVASIACWPVQPVEARTRTTFVFSKANLPGEDKLAALQSSATPQQDAPLPDGKGKDLALKYCTACHAATVWSRQRHGPDQWSALVDNMVSKGLTASDDDLATITDYLATNFGPVKTDAPPAPVPAPPPAR